MALATSRKPPVQRSLSSENIKAFVPEKWRRNAPKKATPNIRAYDQFVRDTFAMSRVPLFRGRSYYELCPLGVDPEPREWLEPPTPLTHLPMPFAPFGTFGDTSLETKIDYSTFRPRRSKTRTEDLWKKRPGQYNPNHIRRPEPVDKVRADRNLERKIDEQRSWRVVVPSVYPTSWEKAYLFDQSRFKSLHALLPNSSVDCYSFSNPRSHKAALMAATMRTSPDFWKYTFPHEYLPSWRLAHLEYYFTHGYPEKKPTGQEVLT